MESIGNRTVGKGAMGEIFISHASADRVLAARIAEGIRQAGHTIFLDSDREDGIAPGGLRRVAGTRGGAPAPALGRRADRG